MLSCSIWFSAPRFWMGGGLESRCVGRVYGADGAARHHPHRTHDLRSGSQDHHPSKNWVQKTICCNYTSKTPDDGRMYSKHVELRIHQWNYLVVSSWHFKLFHISYRFAVSLRTVSGRTCSSVLNLYDIYHCCLYSEKLLMLDRENVRNT
jgi:hypothetical protein